MPKGPRTKTQVEGYLGRLADRLAGGVNVGKTVPWRQKINDLDDFEVFPVERHLIADLRRLVLIEDRPRMGSSNDHVAHFVDHSSPPDSSRTRRFR